MLLATCDSRVREDAETPEETSLKKAPTYSNFKNTERYLNVFACIHDDGTWKMKDLWVTH